ncbi:MAG: hypothetical protein QM734_05755 [Cyclobacteriaceae bacterium]
MKTTTVTLMLLMLTASVSFAKMKQPKADYKVISFKNHALYFKVDKSFIGGTVELYDADNTLIECDDIPHTHTMVDFIDAPSGTYLIKVKKGDKIMEFSYTMI